MRLSVRWLACAMLGFAMLGACACTDTKVTNDPFPAGNTPAVQVPADGTPAVEGFEETKESPAAEESPAVEGSPVAEGSPAVEGSPAAEESPAVEGSPAAEKSPAAEAKTEEAKPEAGKPEAGKPVAKEGQSGLSDTVGTPAPPPPEAAPEPLKPTSYDISITDEGIKFDGDVTLGSTVTFKVTNKCKEPRSFTIEGFKGKTLSGIKPGATEKLEANLGIGLLTVTCAELRKGGQAKLNVVDKSGK